MTFKVDYLALKNRSRFIHWMKNGSLERSSSDQTAATERDRDLGLSRIRDGTNRLDTV